MITKVNHGQGNLLVSYMKLNQQVFEGLYFSRGTYSGFRKGIHAGDFYGRGSPGLLGFDSWIHAGESSRRYSLMVANRRYRCCLT